MKSYYLILCGDNKVERVEEYVDTINAKNEGKIVIHVQVTTITTDRSVITTQVETYL